jgi:hypothetical protein
VGRSKHHLVHILQELVGNLGFLCLAGCRIRGGGARIGCVLLLRSLCCSWCRCLQGGGWLSRGRTGYALGLRLNLSLRLRRRLRLGLLLLYLRLLLLLRHRLRLLCLRLGLLLSLRLLLWCLGWSLSLWLLSCLRLLRLLPLRVWLTCLCLLVLLLLLEDSSATLDLRYQHSGKVNDLLSRRVLLRAAWCRGVGACPQASETLLVFLLLIFGEMRQVSNMGGLIHGRSLCLLLLLLRLRLLLLDILLTRRSRTLRGSPRRRRIHTLSGAAWGCSGRFRKVGYGSAASWIRYCQ